MTSKTEQDQRLFDQIALKYAGKDLTEVSSLPRKNQILNAIDLFFPENEPLGRVLEIGCGSGFYARYLKNRYTSYIGLDHSEKMIEIAHKLHGNLPGVSFKRFDLHTEDVSSSDIGPVDTVIAAGVLHHLEDISATMNKLRNIIGPGGTFLGIEPNSRNPLIQLMRQARKNLDHSYSSQQTYFSREDLIRILEEASFSNIKVSYEGYLSTPFTQVILKPGKIFTPISSLAIKFDNWAMDNLPSVLKKYSWNLIIFSRL